MSSKVSSGPEYPFNKLQAYQSPSWARELRYQPSAYVQLTTRPTPIHSWDLPGVPSGFQVFVKRDDMLGSVLSGNKVRKIEFLLADALQKGCDSVVTCGEFQSNHCRTTAIASRQIGLQPHVVLRWKGKVDLDSVSCQGNLLLDRCAGAKIVLVSSLSEDGVVEVSELTDRLQMNMQTYAKRLESQGSVPYCIPTRGSQLGVWGYIEAFQELQDQGVLEKIDDVVVAMCTGDTAYGLAIANYLTGSKLKIHAVCVCDDADYFYKDINKHLEHLGLTKNSDGTLLCSRDLLDIIEGYIGTGYGLITSDEQAQLLEIFTTTGVSVDPVYTLKGVRGMLSELQNNPGRFAGKRILYIHTGGIFGLYNGDIDEVLKRTPSTNQVYNFEDVVGTK